MNALEGCLFHVLGQIEARAEMGAMPVNHRRFGLGFRLAHDQRELFDEGIGNRVTLFGPVQADERHVPRSS